MKTGSLEFWLRIPFLAPRLDPGGWFPDFGEPEQWAFGEVPKWDPSSTPKPKLPTKIHILHVVGGVPRRPAETL